MPSMYAAGLTLLWVLSRQGLNPRTKRRSSGINGGGELGRKGMAVGQAVCHFVDPYASGLWNLVWNRDLIQQKPEHGSQQSSCTAQMAFCKAPLSPWHLLYCSDLVTGNSGVISGRRHFVFTNKLCFDLPLCWNFKRCLFSHPSKQWLTFFFLLL